MTAQPNCLKRCGGTIFHVSFGLSMALVSATQVLAGPALVELLPNAYLANAAGISANGSVVVGFDECCGNGGEGYRWVGGAGEYRLGFLPDGSWISAATAVNADGSVVVGSSDTSLFGVNGVFCAYRWMSGSGMRRLPDLSNETAHGSQATAVNADGSVIAGWSASSAGTRAVRWTSNSDAQDLGVLSETSNSYARGISGDGSIVVGWCGMTSGTVGNRAFRWTSDGGMQDLGILPGGNYSEAMAISADGRVIVGVASAADGRDHPFRWTTKGGMKDLGVLPGDTFMWAQGINANGSVIVGRRNAFSGFIWTAAMGIVDFDAYVGVNGIQSDPHYGPLIPSGISSDGSAIAANTYPSYHPYLITGLMPQACLGDLNSDHQVDDTDFVIFAAAYDLLLCSDPSMPIYCPADLNGDEQVDDSDFVIFVQAYNDLLCP